MTTTEDFLTAHALLKVTACTLCAVPPLILVLTRFTCLAAVTLITVPFLTHIPLPLLTPHYTVTSVAVDTALVWITAHCITLVTGSISTSCTLTPHEAPVQSTIVLV